MMEAFTALKTDLKAMCREVSSRPAADFSSEHSVWHETGKKPAEIKARLQEIWRKILHEPAYGFALQTAEDELCFVDTGNTDVRTEGQSYGMLAAAMMGDKPVFDNTWRWSLRNMYLSEGPCRGYFAWSVPLDGRRRAGGPAPDGEEFFIWALLWAERRWGSGDGEEDYRAWALRLLHDVLHREEGEAAPLWQPNKLIAFVPGCGFTDPSYHIPHAYELFAEYAPGADRAFWREAAEASRSFLPQAAHPVTGLFPEYAHNDGSPELSRGHGDFYSDAYRCLLNIAADARLCGAKAWQLEIARKQARFFADDTAEKIRHRYALDGRPSGEASLHPQGLLATLAAARAVTENEDTAKLAERFWAQDLRQGTRRYYDNFLHFFAFALLAGLYEQ